MSIIEINNVTKEFKLGQIKSFKHSVLNGFNRLRGQAVEKPKPFKALDNVDFKVEQGEIVAMIGPNGAGKSTLLKIISRISKPTRGSVKVKGSIAPLIEIGAGLVGDLTGRENIYLNGSILGLSRAEIKSKFDEIVAFAELEEFIDTPVKRYSSGMNVRLGFSVAVHTDPEILLIDEILAVGDKAFQRKSFEKLERFKQDGKTFFLVSHNLSQVENICDRAVYLDHGQIVRHGDVKEVISNYVADTINKSRRESGISASEEMRLTDVRIVDEKGRQGDIFYVGQPFIVEIDYVANCPVESPNFTFLVRYGELKVFLAGTKYTGQDMGTVHGEGTVRCCVRNLPLMPNSYEVDVAVRDKQEIRLLSKLTNKTYLCIKPPQGGEDFHYRSRGNMGIVHGHSEWAKQQEPL
jgi:lipopolysaccharide transport system ATP-binding protein